jgi:cyclohexanone monooxygenase
MSTQALAFDPDSLRRKYAEERDKRLRAEGAEQYVEVKGDFAHFLDDPYVEPGFTRAPLRDEVEVVLIGGGFGSLLTGAFLRDAGVKSIRFIDAAGDFGGTWYWNRYPGLACDIESYIYLPLLEETGYMPKQKYADGDEILEHHRRIARHYDLYRDALFQTKVEGLRWDEGAKRWIVATNRGDRIRAQWVAMALGPLNKPHLPGILGINDFEGHAFHACRWDYAYTGGDPHGNLTGLRGKRVGIIGTGATAVQVVPHLGEWADHLYVFQRTPSAVDVKNNPPTDLEWVKSLKPGWQQRRKDNFTILVSGGFQTEDLVNDTWTEILRTVGGSNVGAARGDPEVLKREVELADFRRMEKIRALVDATVRDKKTAEALKPWYRTFCKRPCIHNEYLATFNRPNVTLVDTDGKGVERITKGGVVAAGREYLLDCLVYATGFEFTTSYTRRAGFDIVGRGGESLEKKWSDGIKTFRGMQVHGFPNCFILSIHQTGLSANITHTLEEQAKNIAYVIKTAIARKLTTVEASEQTENEWVSRMIGAFDQNFLLNCTPGYYNNEGHPDARSAQDGIYGGGAAEFFEILRSWRAEGRLRGLEVA